jgi:transposase
VARDYGVGWHTVMRAVRAHGQPLIDDPHRLDGVAHLGMDESAFLRASRLRHTSYVSGLVDTATGRLLDVVEDRTAKAVSDWLAERDPAWLAAVGIVALDPHRGYANAVGVHLGHATLVVDRWHAIRLAGAMVDDVRRRVQQETTGHRGRKDDPLYRIRRTLLMAADRLSDRQWARLEAAWGRPPRRGLQRLGWRRPASTRSWLVISSQSSRTTAVWERLCGSMPMIGTGGAMMCLLALQGMDSHGRQS